MASNRKRDSAQANGSGPVPLSQASAEATLAFEEALGRLDETVAALEGGQLPLHEALALFEEGVRLTQRCQELLDNAELRVQRLRISATQDRDVGELDDTDELEFELEPFDPDESE
jgi:exodeoxyribonuclease VII small subunit